MKLIVLSVMLFGLVMNSVGAQTNTLKQEFAQIVREKTVALDKILTDNFELSQQITQLRQENIDLCIQVSNTLRSKIHGLKEQMAALLNASGMKTVAPR